MPPLREGRRYRAGILGATGSVGQRFCQLLDRHPWFELVAVGASDRSAGNPYVHVVKWKLSTALPPAAGELVVSECTPTAFAGCDVVFSALDASVAGEIEERFAEAGFPVFSNAKNHRFDSDVPLVSALVNPSHLDLVAHQRERRRGFIVCNSNCTISGVVVALRPLLAKCGIESVGIVSMQAVSGAGYPGLSMFDIHDNVIPYISGEEEKVQLEPLKILGTLRTRQGDEGMQIEHATFPISAQCNRVPVLDGHLCCVSVKLTRSDVSVEDVKEWMRSYDPGLPPLPSAPTPVVHVREEPDRPQTRLDRETGRGYAVSVGRVRTCPLSQFKFVVLAHNTVLGAAGGALLNAELAGAQGLLC